MIQVAPAFEYPHCAHLKNDHAELIVTTDVGPRILSYRLLPDGENPLKIYEEQLGKQNEFEWQPRGGHRLWVAPEDNSLTYVPDNTPIAWEEEGENTAIFLNAATPPWSLEKQISVTLAAESPRVELTHRIVNRSDLTLSMAPWALTVMRPGGFLLVPQPPLGEHPRDLLPNRRLVLWPYTHPGDERFHFGESFIGLRQSSEAGIKPTKAGLTGNEGVAYYIHGKTCFRKTFAYDEEALYADLGCNFETFTDSGMLEVETLGALRQLEPGQTAEHREIWELFALDSTPDFHDENGWKAVLNALPDPVYPS